MLTIHGNLTTCGQRVLYCFLEMGLVEGKDFQLVPIQAFHEIKSPEWLEKQPFGQMPYLVDEETGQVIFESRAIARYVALKYRSHFLPSTTDLDSYVKFEIGASVETANFDPDIKKIFTTYFGADYAKIQVDSVTIEAHEKEIIHKLEGYERILSKQKYLGGDQVTLVDFFHLPFGTYVVSKGSLKQLTDGTFPHVAAWWKDITERPHWKAVEKRRNDFLEVMLRHAP